MSNKPPIRLKFSESSAKSVASQHSAKPTRQSPPSIGTEKLVAKCGHPITIDLYAKDPFRDGRRQKATSRDCPACRQARAAADVVAAAERRTKKVAKKGWRTRPRLPDGARFTAVYDAVATQWDGTLTIGGAVFERRAGGLKKLLDRLDDAYRETSPPLIVVDSPDQPSAA
jgi:hypothetical protein